MHKYSISVSEIAESDIISIFEYISKDNISAGKKLVKLFYRKFEHLAMFPYSGYKNNLYKKKEVMFLKVAKHYKIVYKVENDIVYIYRIITDYQQYI